MKNWNWLLLIPLLINFTQCKNSKTDQLQTSKNINDTIPQFDSINWASAYQFQKIDLVDQANKYRFLDKFYHDFWMHKNVSGGFLVAQHGKIIYEGYSGFSDIENQIPLTAETPIHIASITKVLTGLAILKLVEFDKIKLNHKVSKYLKGFPYEDVTIEDLMNHRSGLPNYLHLSDDKNYWDNSKKMTNQDVLEILIQKKPEATGPAGKNFSYNNTNFVLLALIIEKVTGLSYPKAMKKMVFNPLGMKNTFVMEFEKDSARVSKSYYNNGRPWNYDHLDVTYGDKNIYSTPRDLFQMDLAMYSDQFLPKKLKEKAWKGYSYESKGVKNYGLGIRLMEWDNGGKILYHNGWWHGNNTTYVRDFENEATIISLGNRKNRTIYSTFRLVSLFGDYPFRFPDASDSHSGKSEDSLKNLEKQMDSVKQKTRKDKVEHLEEKVDSIKGKIKK
ncbi:serine hydrolase domain-containing protein [Moheibacter lacus]|uniref:Beta-lactamase family protein n=1 Tax=Moheibacter lacus TaxID=2745851 RepID=A0A838ZUK8_9FLAO|nr:serine hydrolase domain-containing protein [Moheibacter lacus]MBA5630599.1 beta-lactamase family protein [Moheibacter lacus]